MELRPQRVLYVPRFGGSPVDPEIAAHVAEAARNLEALGHTVAEGEAPFDLAALDRIWSVVGPAGLAALLRNHPAWQSLVQEPLRRIAEQGAALQAADYVDALEKVTLIRSGARRGLHAPRPHPDALFRGAALAPPRRPTRRRSTANRSGRAAMPCSRPSPMSAGLPGISIPCRPARNGLPIAMQLVGRYGAEELLLSLALQYERAHPWADRWPTLD